MKKILVALALMIPVLSGCIIIPIDPSFRITSARSKTNYILTKDGQSNFVICNDSPSTLDYEFTYSGTLTTWESYVQGENSDRIAGRTTFVPGDDKSSIDYANKTVKVSYSIPVGTAPTLLAPQGITSNITVNPTAVIVGYSRLYITAEGFSGGQVFDSAKMAVVDNCKDFLN
jgi:hypothetical protein